MVSAAAARSDAPPPSRRVNRPRAAAATTTRRASPESSRRRRHAHITKRGRGRWRPHHVLRPCSSTHHSPNRETNPPTPAAPPPPASAELSTSQDQQLPQHPARSTSCAQIDISHLASKPKKRKLILRPCSSHPQPHNYNYWGAKRARTTRPLCRLPLPANNWRDWANLDDGPLGQIAELVLAYDVADYLRFRAACCRWRRCSIDPRDHGGLDRRFHPRRWTMLQDQLALPESRCFLNTSTGECIKVRIPELCDHELLAVTPEGLLVLLRGCKHVRLLNPLTRHLTKLPPLTTLLPSEDHDLLEDESNDGLFDVEEFVAWGSGIAGDDSTFVLCLKMLGLLGTAKPGDDHWTSVNYNADCRTVAPLMFEGCFYCVGGGGVMVLVTGQDEPPRLEVAAKLENMHVSRISDSLHFVDNNGELMLVHRRRGFTMENIWGSWYDTYRVDLGTRTLLQVKSLGGGAGRAVFIGMHCSLSVSLEVFPSGSINANTIYLSFDVGERARLEVGAYHLADGSIECPSTYNGCLVPRPHTLVDCLSLSNTVRVLDI